jgi:hypothetical protein
MKNILTITSAILLFSNISYADGISISKGQSTSKDESNTKSYSYIFESDYTLPYFTELNLKIDLDVTVHFWQNLYGPDITAGSAIPMFTYKLRADGLHWFLRAGIGVAYVDQTIWGKRDLGNNWLFADKVDVGFELNKAHQFTLSLKHYSNAATNNSNDGTNIISINYTYRWN